MLLMSILLRVPDGDGGVLGNEGSQMCDFDRSPFFALGGMYSVV